MWHVLDVGSIWVKEFTSALSRFVPALGWSPVMSWSGFAQRWERAEEQPDPPLTVHHFPLQRGYHRFPVSVLSDLGRRQTRRMLARDSRAQQSPLICTTPYYAPVAERWNGPIVYYQTDLTFAYPGLDAAQIQSLDTRLCRVATAVCPNSRRIASYMVQKAGCDPGKIEIVPNATRQENILPQAPRGAGRLPADLSDLPRPVLGVLGNLAANLDWVLLLEAVERTPDCSWAFVGPTNMEVYDPDHRAARERLINWGKRVRFVGAKPYGLLQVYARAVDAAILPYRRKEPTFSGSSTRFYEHLAACRPMLATRGFEELLRKEPLLRLIDTPDELVREIDRLRRINFEDGFEEERWQASRSGTWNARALSVILATSRRWAGSLDLPELSPEVFNFVNSETFHLSKDTKFQLASAE